MTHSDGEETIPNDSLQDAGESQPAGVSSYATGGGRITFERKVAVGYLAHILLGDGAAELGEGRRIVSLGFQQAPKHGADDLVVHAVRENEIEPSLVLAIAVRRSPNMVPSDAKSRILFQKFLEEIIEATRRGPEHGLVLVVSGPLPHAEQLAEIANIARYQKDASGFFDLVGTKGKFSKDLRGRLNCVQALVKSAMTDIGIDANEDEIVRHRTWELLSRLTVLMPRLETPDETDWANLANALKPVARGQSLDGASRLRDRLAALAQDYAPSAAIINITLLRRDAHAALDSHVRLHAKGWNALGHLNDRAFSSTRDAIASSHNHTVHIDRSDIANELLRLTDTAMAIVVYGDSGVGKSALVVRAATQVAKAGPELTQITCVTLRHLPSTTLEFETNLGSPLVTLLGELSAPRRLLVIDGADAAAEGRLPLLGYLIDAAFVAGVAVVAVSATENKTLLYDALVTRYASNTSYFHIPKLTDPQVDQVVSEFGELITLAANSHSREILRRPVVIDLLVRSGNFGVPLSAAEAMNQIWDGLILHTTTSERGTPRARETAMLLLAKLALLGGEPLEVVGAIDQTALNGLQQDGLLQKSAEDPYQIVPEFAHDEIRRYAIARFLLAQNDPFAQLEAAGVPRFFLSAARLACQALLLAQASAKNPSRGRLSRLQSKFDSLVLRGHGERWGDVPGEALLTMGNPEPVLRDSWPALREDNDKGLQRLCRLIDQRLRDDSGFVRVPAVQPLVSLILDDETPWHSGEHIQGLLRDWLRALVVADTAGGDPLRERLRDRLIAACNAADVRLAEQRAAAAAALAARTPEQIESEKQIRGKKRISVTDSHYRGHVSPNRRELPREITDEIVVELLALLGPDLGQGGEAILRRVAHDAPSRIAPAVEEFGTGRAIAAYAKGLLAHLTAAYYIDEHIDSFGFNEGGIRSHHSGSLGVTPLAAWFRGPFCSLFQSDFRGGIAVLNRMLNHAARERARALTRRDTFGRPVDDGELDLYRSDLNVSGSKRGYVGDAHTWMWYRGTGVGPYPCMSALQALERVCDQLIESGIRMGTIVAILVDGCSNLAMLGLVVGLLMRHLKTGERLLDPYLAEPEAWFAEFHRVINEGAGLAAPSEGLVAPERRRWTLRDAARFLAERADDTRAEELRSIGDRLIANARRLIESDLESGGVIDDHSVQEQLASVRAWASELDRDRYEGKPKESGLIFQNRPPDSVKQTLSSRNLEFERTNSAIRLINRYRMDSQRAQAVVVSPGELATDLAEAQKLLDSPLETSVSDPWDGPTAVAAHAIEAYLLGGVAFPNELLLFAVNTVLRVGAGEGLPRPLEYAETYFQLAANRSAARVLPLLLLPVAADFRALADGSDGLGTLELAVSGGTALARAVANEVRVQLARGLDHVWQVPCAKHGRCHHEIALGFLIESMRDSAIGKWDHESQRCRVVVLDDPIEQTLDATADNEVFFSRLDAAIRALAPASIAGMCVSARARQLLNHCLSAHRRSLLAHEYGMDDRGASALIAARAVLTLATSGEDGPLFHHIAAFADNTSLLGNFLRALSAAAEEHPDRAIAARRLWPDVVSHVISLHEAGHELFDDRHHGDYTLASLMPAAAGEVAYLYRELDGDPITWWDPLALKAAITRWIPFATGHPICVHQFINFLRPLASADQVRLGLPSISPMMLAKPDQISLLTKWLIEHRSAAADEGLKAEWQRLVDALVVAGESRLASYSE